MTGEAAQPYSRRGANGETYEIWVLGFTPSFFRPYFKYWRFMLPSLGCRVIVALSGGNRRRLISRVVDARFFDNRREAEAGIDRIEARIRAGNRPWADDPEPQELTVPKVGSEPDRPPKEHLPRPDLQAIALLRPRNGLPSFRRKAGFSLKEGVITASDRRGRSRSFAIDGTDRSPVGFLRKRDLEGLVDGAGNMLTRSYGVDWGSSDFINFLVAADLRWVSDDSDSPDPPLRSDGIEISTFNPIPIMTVSSTVALLVGRLSDFNLFPGVVTWTIVTASALVVVGSFGFAVMTDADEPEDEKRAPRSPNSESRRQRRKVRKRRLRRRAAD